MMLNNPQLPIKVVVPIDSDYPRRRPLGPQNERIKFETVDVAYRQRLSEQVESAVEVFKSAWQRFPSIPAVAVLELRDGATAKTHRKNTFLKKTCPIIGQGQFTQLYISLSESTSRLLQNAILTVDQDDDIGFLSAIARIRPYSSDDVLGQAGHDELLNLETVKQHGLKLRLFNHGSEERNKAVRNGLLQIASESGLQLPGYSKYSDALEMFRVYPANSDQLIALASFPGVRRIARYPVFQTVKTASTPRRPMREEDWPKPDEETEYATVAVVDSGTPEHDRFLSDWRIGRYCRVPAVDQDNSHGSFVSSLIVAGRPLNGDQDIFPEVPCKIIDIACFPKTGEFTEDDLLDVLDEALPKFSDQSKVWNLSMQTEEPCDEEAFSDLAVALDYRSDKYGVTFVIAAGNTSIPRRWKPDSLSDSDRVCPPADSARSIVVGGVAHTDRATGTLSRALEPSPFTRCGPGAAYLRKPDLCHVAGNMYDNFRFDQLGLLSYDGNGSIAEDIGTSFGAPLGASLLANLYHNLDAYDPLVSRALLLHSAYLNAPFKDDLDMRFRGFGMPPNLASILNCDPWRATLLFELEVPAGCEFAKADFPMPACLIKDSKLFGTFVMTWAYDPPLDSRYGAEYIRTNVDVRLGPPKLNPKTGRLGYPSKLKPSPKYPVTKAELRETYLREHGFKWSPVGCKTGNLRATAAADWQLGLTVQYRDGFKNTEPQKVAVVVSLIDPKRMLDVYNDVVTALRQSEWNVHDLRLRSRGRARP